MSTESHDEAIRYTADVVLLAVLLIQRRWDPHAASWALPGGHCDAGETSLQAAVRELEEETGITIPADTLRQVGAFDGPGRDPRGRYVTVAYTATLPEPVAPTPMDDAVATGDPLKLMRLFGITAQTAMRYVAAAYPERTARLPRWPAATEVITTVDRQLVSWDNQPSKRFQSIGRPASGSRALRWVAPAQASNASPSSLLTCTTRPGAT
ncbi:NUDIX domain-containing protein [Streptomyces globisporus]